MLPLISAELLGAIVGICAVLLAITGPDLPPPDPSADPVVTREEAQAAKRATWRECAAKLKRGESCHPREEN